MSDRYLTKLSAKHKQLARLLVGGHSQSGIAKILKVHKSTISRVVRDPLILQEIERLQELADVNTVACVPGIPEKVSEGAQKGTEVLIEILEDERTTPEMLKLKANVALELLSRVGYGPIRQINVQAASVPYYTSEEIENLKRRVKLEMGD